MSKTLALIGSGWDSAQFLAARGRRTEALARLRNLLARPDLPTSVAVDAHLLRGKILLENECYSAARRHFKAASALVPAQAEIYYQRALAYEQDPEADDSVAARLFRKASRLAPQNPMYRAAFGRAAIRSHRLACGIRELRAAVMTAPGDLAVIRVATEGLIEARQFGTARILLNMARFLCHEPVQAREVTRLADSVRFAATRCQQRRNRRQRIANSATDGGLAVLSFPGCAAHGESRAARAISAGMSRRDVVSMPRPHFPKLKVRRADR